jgi:hypothetical protein
MPRLSPLAFSSHLRGCAIAFACIAVLAAAAPAQAGLGGLTKKAKDKATRALGQKAAPASQPEAAGEVEFDDVVLELTNDRLDHIVAAFEAAQAASAGRPELARRLEQVKQQRSALWDKEGDRVRARRNQRDEVQVCLHDGYREAQDRRAQEYANQALTDPTIREKYTRAAAENNAAAAKGDSAAIGRIMQTFHEVSAPTRDDSLAVQRKCGGLPPRLPAEDKLDALDQQSASLEEQIRAIDEKVAEAQAEHGGLDRQQWSMAIERIEMYLSAVRAKQSPRGFSPAELDALEKHLQQLKAAVG